MNFTINRENFLSLIRLAKVSIAARTTLPILGNIHLELVGKTLSATGSNLDQYVTVCAQVEAGSAGTITLPANKLESIVASAPGKSITLTIDEKKKIACVKYQTGKSASQTGQATVLGLPSDEYPNIPDAKRGETMGIKAIDFQRAYVKVHGFSSTDETRFAMNGIRFDFAKDGTFLAATDGRKLATVRLADANKEMQSFTLPNQAARILNNRLKLVESGEDAAIDSVAIRIWCEGDEVKSATFVFEDGWTLTSKLIDAPYPNYRRVIPATDGPNLHSVTLPVADFSNALRRVSLVAKDDVLKVSFSDGRATITASAPDVGEGEDSFPIQFNSPAEDFHYSFNLRFMETILSACDCESLRIFFGDGDAGEPAVINNKGDSYIAVLMPIATKHPTQTAATP